MDGIRVLLLTAALVIASLPSVLETQPRYDYPTIAVPPGAALGKPVLAGHEASSPLPNSTSQTKAILASAAPAEPSLDVIFPPDGRERITPTTSYPWRTITKLYIYRDGQVSGTCSGAVIDAFHVLTAGHCVYLWDDGVPVGWASAIRVVPGHDGPSEPYGEAWATYFRTYTAWTDSADYRHDWGLITLDRNVGLHTGWMGRMTAASSDSVYTGILNTAGYPGDLDQGMNLYFTSDDGCSADEYNHYFWLDAAGGQSGSPVWTYDGTNRYILSVLAYSNPDCNVGTRLNSEKFDTLFGWLAADTPPTDYADLADAGSEFASVRPTLVAPSISSLTVSVGARNRGTAASGGFYVRFCLSTDLNIDARDTALGEVFVSSLAPFESRTVTWTGTVPASVSSGSYWVGWVLDSRNLVAEFEETNNIGLLSQRMTVDAEPPRTMATVSGEAGSAAWYRSAVRVSLAAADSLSGVARTLYRFGDGAWTTYAGPIDVDEEGMHTLEFYSVDRAGNIEATVRVPFGVDTRPPEELHVLVPGDGQVLHSGAVEVRYEASDSESGIAYYLVQLDDRPPAEVGARSWHNFTDVSDGVHIVRVTAVDEAGNEKEVSASFRVDTSVFSGFAGLSLILGVMGIAATASFLVIRMRRRRMPRRPPAIPPPSAPPPAAHPPPSGPPG